MDRAEIVYLTQPEFAQLDIAALDKVLNGIHVHRSRLDGQEVFAMQARAVLTHGRNRRPEPAPRPHPDNSDDYSPDSDAGGCEDNLDDGCDTDPGARDTGTGPDGGVGVGAGCAGDPGAARSKRELRDAERRAHRLADFPEIAEALAAGQISTVQADMISRAKVPTRTKLDLLADAKHQHADETAEAVKAAVIEADTETAQDRYDRQVKNRRAGSGVNEDGMYWFNILLDPVTGARIRHAYDPRYRIAWAREKELDFTIRRDPKQVAADIIANMLLGYPASYDLHPQTQTSDHQTETGWADDTEPWDDHEHTSPTFSAEPSRLDPESGPASGPARADGPKRRSSRRSTDTASPARGVRFVEITKNADGTETRTDLGTHTPIRPPPIRHQHPPNTTNSDTSGTDLTDSDGTCPTCRSSGPASTQPSKQSTSRTSRGRPAAGVNVVIALSDLNNLGDSQAVGYTADGVPIPATLIRSLMCDAEVSFWVEQADSTKLSLARTVRYATPAQHQAPLVRDGGCVWKHCNLPASACQAHHITFWEHGGPTDLDNLCLLCPAHHRKLHAMGAHIRPERDTPKAWYLTSDHNNQTIKQWTNPPHRQKPGHNAA